MYWGSKTVVNFRNIQINELPFIFEDLSVLPLSMEQYNTLKVTDTKDYAVIKIGDNSSYIGKNTLLDHNNTLILHFSDIVKEDYSEQMWLSISNKAFTEFMALQLIEFIEKNKDKKFIIHCHVGERRSYTTAVFIAAYLGRSDTVEKLEKLSWCSLNSDMWYILSNYLK